MEMLIVAATLVVLAGLLVPGGWRARHLARRTQCQSNQRQLCSAMAMYTAEHRVFPVASGAPWLTVEQSLLPVLRCPNSPISTYVHNRWGASGVADPWHLGLGPRAGLGTSVSAVVSPSECILVYDPIPALGPPRSRPGMLPIGDADPALVRMHGQKGNLGFVDGHVVAVSVDRFARGHGSIRHHWNIDNLAHDELWP